MYKFIFIVAISILLIALGISELRSINPNALNNKTYGNITYATILLVLFLTAILSKNLRSIIRDLKFIGIWAFMFILLIGAYGFRFQIQNFYTVVLQNLIPSKVTINSNGAVEIAQSSNGHYMLTASINNTPVYFMVDTGATNVALTKNDALKIGVNVDQLTYNQASNTANGINYSASIIIPEIVIGNIKVQNVSASIVKSGLDISLLGMSFLSKLTSYSVERDLLIMEK
jgi:aspartyl protease family protein